MAKKIKHILGFICDRPAEWVLQLIDKKLHICLKPSTSRWGFVAIFLALGFFFLALFFTMPTPPHLGDRMWLFWLGIAPTVTAFYIGVYFLRHQGCDPSSKQLTSIEEGIASTNLKLDRTEELLKQLIERLDK